MNFSSNKFRWFLLSMLSLLLSWMTYSVFYNTAIQNEQQQFQDEFTALEKKQTTYLKSLRKSVENGTIERFWSNESFQTEDFYINVFKDDAFVFWNSIDFQTRRSNLTLESHTLVHTWNGYFLTDYFKAGDFKVLLCTKIKNDYFYQNEDLVNQLNPFFSTPNEVTINQTKSNDSFAINGRSGEPLFYISIQNEKSIAGYKQFLIFSLFLLGVVSLLISVTIHVKQFASGKFWLIALYPLVLLGIRYFSIRFSWINYFSDFELFDPNLYANSELIPNLGSLIISLVVVFIIVWWLLYHVHFLKLKSRINAVVLIVLYIGLLIYSLLISDIFASLIINSSISLEIDEVFSLTLYSFISLGIITTLFFSYYLLARQFINQLVHSIFPLNQLAAFWFISSVVFVFIELVFIQNNILNIVWPILLNALLFYFLAQEYNLNRIKYQIIILVTISMYGALILFENTESNEHQKRELYANQLITDQNPTMELEYASTLKKLKQDPSFKSLVQEAKEYSAPLFSMQLENCCFNDFWERYEIDYFFFNEDGSPLIDYMSNQTQKKEDLDHIIDAHSDASSISKGLYFVKDYHDQLSYIGRQTITLQDSSQLDFYVLFKSKKIPEQIGFPRLLMNEKSYALQDLEEYSIARYSKGELLMRFGNFNYPTQFNSFFTDFHEKSGFTTINGMSHLVYHQEDGQSVVISLPDKSFIAKLSTFSYLFIFFGIFSLLVLLFFNWSSIFPLKSLQLSLKVQIVLVSIVVGSFLIFLWIAIQNTTRQYAINTENKIKEKVYSVNSELEQKLGKRDTIDKEVVGDYMNYLLNQYSATFVTDINFYGLGGNLLATSQPKLYTKGVSVSQMDDRAFYFMNYKQKSDFMHHETIGNLSFLSAYVPFNNHEGKLLGYLNLQHFSKQNTFEKQVNSFIVTIINIAVLLLVITVVVAIFVSGWITTPLRLIKDSFQNVEFGKENKPIDYHGDDEIGALVKDYNNKLAELELKAIQLARTERETAWREMAKQVAHEIKNPLTPMKLSVQHFQRSFDPNSPNAKEKMDRIVGSLIEQIDALTKIANEFSNFAKMPKANEEKLDLAPVLKNVVDLYSSPDVEIKLSNNFDRTVSVFVDRDLIIRVFNNLIKNAIQAVEEDQKTIIHIDCEVSKNHYVLSFKDNGKGIPEETRKKIFTPNFTTKTTGSGLGLAMVKQIITNHNGEIWFETEIGKGTIFYVKLPVFEE